MGHPQPSDAPSLARHASRHFTHDVAVIWTQNGQTIKKSLCDELEAGGLAVVDGTAPDGVDLGLGHIVGLYYCSSTSYRNNR